MSKRLAWIVVFLIAVANATAQNGCPPNIGFEDGSFTNWNCFLGTINGDGSIQIGPTPPIQSSHYIWPNSYPQVKDQYGGFPVNCPNGSGYSIQLGNQGTGRGAERVSYTFQVPPDKDDYSIIYHYAVVFQDPAHPDIEQPKFTAKVYDNTSGVYLSCGAFEFVASGSLPGFQLSGMGSNVYFKPWSPVTLKLENCAGKTITLEFTTNDCTRGGHFGYAYIDVDENCTSPVTGNVYCNGATSIKLTAPFGFQSYNWYDENFTTVLGTSNTLTISPPPPPGTKYALEIIPYPGIGCQDTVITTVVLSPEAFVFNLAASTIGCQGTTVDLTDSGIKTGSSPGLTYSYYKDPEGLEYVPTPAYIDSAKTYYIKAVNNAGCTEIKPINVSFINQDIKINNPPEVCYPATINLTDPSVTAGSAPNYSYSYYADLSGTIPLANATAVNTSGEYYIKASSAYCSLIKQVIVKIDKPNLVTTPLSGCGTADLTSKDVTSNTNGLDLSYWTDAACTIPVTKPDSIVVSGIYYIKGVNAVGCSTIVSEPVTVLPMPDLVITSLQAVTAPATLSIISAVAPVSGVDYSYWKNENATEPIPNPASIRRGGVYYIKATSSDGCSVVRAISIVIHPPPPPVFVVPNAFSPNKDGINDVLRASVKGDVTMKEFTIYNRWGQLLFQTRTLNRNWDGTFNGKPLPNGTYYWMMEVVDNYYGTTVRHAGDVTIIR